MAGRAPYRVVQIAAALDRGTETKCGVGRRRGGIALCHQEMRQVLGQALLILGGEPRQGGRHRRAGLRLLRSFDETLDPGRCRARRDPAQIRC